MGELVLCRGAANPRLKVTAAPRARKAAVLRPLREIQLQRHQIVGAERRLFGSHTVEAGTQPPLHGAQCLPLQPIRRPSIGLPLAHGFREQGLAPVPVVAMRAGQVHLADALEVERLAAFVAVCCWPRHVHLDGDVLRLVRHEGRERQQFA